MRDIIERKTMMLVTTHGSERFLNGRLARFSFVGIDFRAIFLQEAYTPQLKWRNRGQARLWTHEVTRRFETGVS